jgi:16S rRNA A1518/A1519 N6-dimethyltransferase RsmA/KsgA/DIM1 with predicted DNA glycosylase/AP lyase activity
MVELSEIKVGERVADLGSGDGRISIAFGKKGAIVTGYELDDRLIKESQKEIQNQKLGNNVIIKKEDFWNTDLSSYDVIVVYPMPDIMAPLEKKLLEELKDGARVLSNFYTFPKWKYTECKDKIYLYEYNE